MEVTSTPTVHAYNGYTASSNEKNGKTKIRNAVHDVAHASGTSTMTAHQSNATVRQARADANTSVSKSKQLRLKCKYGSETRLVVINEKTTYEHLLDRLNSDYGFPVSLKYKDEDGDAILLSSENDMKEMIRHQSGTVTVLITPRRATLDVSSALSGPTPSTPAHQLNPLPQPAGEKDGGNAQTVDVKRQQKFSSNDDQYPLRPYPRAPSAFWAGSLALRGGEIEGGSGISHQIRWRRGDILGSGAFGTVYLGLRADTGEFMAVKELRRDEVSAKELAVLENEIEMLKTLHHENIVRYLGTERTNDSLCIFLEYVPGGSVQKLVHRFGALEEGVVQMYTRQILRGLEYLHGNGIAHRDIKGANVLVGNDGIVKLADFGASKKMSQQSIIVNTTASSVSGTGAGGMKGTPLWMAPEVIRSQQTALGWKKADVWSVGCTVVEMLTGQPPWPDCDHPMSVMFKVACDNETPTLPPSASRYAHDFLKTCFQHDPAARPDVSALLLHPFVSQIPESVKSRHNPINQGLGYPMRPTTADANDMGSRKSTLWSQPAWAVRDRFALTHTEKSNQKRRALTAAHTVNNTDRRDGPTDETIKRGNTAIGLSNPTAPPVAVLSDFDRSPAHMDQLDASTFVKRANRAASAGPRSYQGFRRLRADSRSTRPSSPESLTSQSENEVVPQHPARQNQTLTYRAKSAHAGATERLRDDEVIEELDMAVLAVDDDNGFDSSYVTDSRTPSPQRSASLSLQQDMSNTDRHPASTSRIRESDSPGTPILSATYTADWGTNQQRVSRRTTNASKPPELLCPNRLHTSSIDTLSPSISGYSNDQAPSPALREDSLVEQSAERALYGFLRDKKESSDRSRTITINTTQYSPEIIPNPSDSRIRRSAPPSSPLAVTYGKRTFTDSALSSTEKMPQTKSALRVGGMKNEYNGERKFIGDRFTPVASGSSPNSSRQSPAISAIRRTRLQSTDSDEPTNCFVLRQATVHGSRIPIPARFLHGSPEYSANVLDRPTATSDASDSGSDRRLPLPATSLRFRESNSKSQRSVPHEHGTRGSSVGRFRRPDLDIHLVNDTTNDLNEPLASAPAAVAPLSPANYAYTETTKTSSMSTCASVRFTTASSNTPLYTGQSGAFRLHPGHEATSVDITATPVHISSDVQSSARSQSPNDQLPPVSTHHSMKSANSREQSVDEPLSHKTVGARSGKSQSPRSRRPSNILRCPYEEGHAAQLLQQSLKESERRDTENNTKRLTSQPLNTSRQMYDYDIGPSPIKPSSTTAESRNIHTNDTNSNVAAHDKTVFRPHRGQNMGGSNAKHGKLFTVNGSVAGVSATHFEHENASNRPVFSANRSNGRQNKSLQKYRSRKSHSARPVRKRLS